MKSVVLIIWLTLASGHEEVILKHHYDDLATCEAKAQAVSAHYAEQGQKTRHLCHAVVNEIGDVDENGNPTRGE